MKKRIVSFLLAVAMVVGLMPYVAFESKATASAITTNLELAARAENVAKNYKTLYVMGGWGGPLTESNKQRYIDAQSYNQSTERKAMINAASSDTFAFDCVCLIKALLWGWDGDLSNKNGGAIYASNGVPDINTGAMIEVCSEISTDFSNVEIGELLWMQGHVGVYIGNGLAVECSPAWENGVQITACNCSISGYNTRNWTKHGKLPYVTYIPASDGYLAECSDLLPSYGEVTITTACNPRTLPCNSTTASNYGYTSEALTDKALSVGDKVTVNGIILNTEDNYWYKVTLSDGTSAYVYSARAGTMTQKWPYIDGDIMPDSISGSTLLSGTIKTGGSLVESVQAFVYKGYSLSGGAVIQSDLDSVSITDSYALCRSDVDYSLPFQNLANYGSGYYTVGFEVAVTNYHLNSNGEAEAVRLCVWAGSDTFAYGTPASCSHSYTSAVTDPTCATDGYTTFTCTSCGYSYTDYYIGALGHDYQSVVTAPTLTDMGYTTYTCTNCGDCFVSDYTDPVGVTFEILVDECWGVGVDEGDIVYCSFTPEESGEYVFYSENSGDTYGYLYDSNLNLLAYNDDGGSDLNFSIEYYLDAGTTYYYAMRYYSSTEYGSIDVYLYRKLNADVETKVTISNGGTDRYLRFVPEYSGNYTFYSVGSGDPKANLYDSEWDILASNDDADGWNFEITYYLEAGVPYYLLVRFIDSAATGTISTYVRRNIESGVETPVNITYGGEEESLMFIPEYSAYYTFLSTGTADTVGYLYDGNMNYLDSNDDGGENNNYSITYWLNAGERYVISSGFYSSSVTGEITVLVCRSIDTNVENLAEITAGGGDVYFTYTPEYTEDYTFYSYADGDTYVQLYDSDMNELASDDDGGENLNFSITYTLSAGVTYIYRVRYYSISNAGTIPVVLYPHHSFEEDVIREATCTQDGEILWTCTVCGESFNVTIAAIGHSYGDWYVNAEATCTTDGEMRHDCVNCDHYETEVIEATGHAYTATTVQPTCTAQGFTMHVCSKCSDWYMDSYIAATGHSYGAWYSTSATEQRRDCENCDHYETKTVSSNPFVDVVEGKYYYESVMWAVENGVTSGRTPTYFGVGETCTREQIVTFLWRALGEPQPTTTVSPFTDVQNSSAYYYDAVLWAVETGVTSGRTDTYFGVGEDCTRAQIVTFLWRAMGEQNPSNTVSNFPDVQSSNAYYYKAVLWAVEEGITSGMADGTFGVENACTREQCVTFLHRALA